MNGECSFHFGKEYNKCITKYIAAPLRALFLFEGFSFFVLKRSRISYHKQTPSHVTNMTVKIIQIGHDDASIRSYVEQYKSFRLEALKTEPEAFASKYEDELKFTDEVWYGRLANPDAVTFLAMQDGETLSTLTALGNLKYGPDE